MRKHLVGAALAAVLAVTSACSSGEDGSGPVAQLSAEDLRAAVSNDQARAFYEARNWQAAWPDEQAAALVERLKDAPRHGLTAADFLGDVDAAKSPASREAALTTAALLYGNALAYGRADPKKVAKLYTVPGPDTDVAAGLTAALGEGKVGAWLDGLAPQDAEYRALSEAYLQYSRQAAGAERPAAIPAGDAIDPGSRDPRLPAIAAALRALGYAEPATPENAASGANYGPDLVTAVKRLQADHGLEQDGVIGADVLAALNGGAAERARILAINLERRRWLQRTPPATRIDVNTAAAFLDYIRDGKGVDRRVVVVGQSGWETPQLGSPITRLVANPPWNVPESIETKELMPKGAAYLARNNFTRKDGRLVQEAGPTSALGLVKFDMDNPHAIYLHDTPSKAAFKEAERHMSHGCVRVLDAIGFARLIADHEGQLDAFNRALASGKETFVPLPRQIPVRLLYHTAFVENGAVRFRPDVYGWDEDLANALGMEKRSRPVARKHVGDTGP
ncbi:L,D-transpeptidase family protein [Allosphingosinicella vermicomposti]|uniref:L,D-transpeptidase family protein n=1 Tax=Allosphingosinicella vermicomposti TaxID=614671 RepID=UPI000D0ED525|nr:L,D-transpeptidase family protein [Allosphingosinicella vermicomposti]